MNLDIDIVIPCAGRVADLLRLLTSLRTHCASALATQVCSITVTDDRPSGALRETLAREFPIVRYTHGPAMGPAANRNHGARQGHAPWVLFLDDDCYLGSDLLGAYARQHFKTPECDVLEGAIHPVGDRPNGNHHAPLNLTGGHLWSCNIMLRRSVFDSLRGFDETFPFACLEDSDLAARLHEAGAQINFVAAAFVFHPWRSISEREVTRQIISHAIYGEKHANFVRTWSFLHLLRALRGRARLYAVGRFASIPLIKYRTVAYDSVAPILVFAVLRLGPLRRALCARYGNPLPAST